MNANIYHKHKDIIITTFIIASRAYLQHYQQGLRRYHSRRVRTRTFQEGDLVLCLIQDKKGMHKLSPPWEGPFAIGRVLGNDAYYLIDVRGDGELDVKRPWNVNLLRKFYS